MSSDSLKKRYFYKLFSNFFSLLINLFTISILPRALGVVNFGNYSFTTTLVTQFLNLIELRSSTCFYSKLSQRPKENKLIIFYSYVTLIIFAALITLILVVTLSPLRKFIFPGQDMVLIFLSLVFVIMTWIQGQFTTIMDAYGATVPLEKLRIVNRILAIGLLASLFYFKLLSLYIFFYYQYFILLLLIIGLFRYLKIKINLTFTGNITKSESKKYLTEFYRYTGPLGIYVILQFLRISFDRLILQHFGGGYQQGLYAFASNATNFCFFFMSTMLPLFMRELSLAYGEADIDRMAKIYRQYLPLLYAITAYFSSFIFVESDTVANLFGGTGFKNAETTIKVLSFYTLVYVYSNLNNSVIFANGRTSILLKLSLLFTPISMISTYLLLSDGNFGFNLGANGLAIKELCVEFVTVIIILYLNTSFLKVKFSYYLIHMIMSVIPFIAAAYFLHYTVNYFSSGFGFSSNIIFLFFVKGALYSATSLIIVWLFPTLSGLTRNDILLQLNELKTKIHKR